MSVSSAATGERSSSPPLTLAMLQAREPLSGQSGFLAWKTHSTVEKVLWKGGVAAAAAAGAKLIVVSRNAKDTAVSMLHHTANIPPFGFTGGWEEFAPLFLAGSLVRGCI